MTERKEAWMRIIIGIISGIILYVWHFVVMVLAIFHWFYVIFTGSRKKGIAEFCNLWVTQAYRYYRYMTFSTNARPFPFTDMGMVLHPVEIKNKK